MRLGPWLGMLGLAAGGCSSQTRCTENCPDVSGVYQVLSNTPQGSCPFSPYLVGASIELTQAGGSGQVETFAIDPTNQLPFPLSGDLFVPQSPDADDLGRVVVHAQTVRAAHTPGDPLLVLNVDLVLRVFVADGRRQLSGYLATVNMGDSDAGVGCTVQLDFVAQQ